MDLNKMKQKAFFLFSTLDRTLEKSRWFTQKALEYTSKVVVKAPILLNSLDEFEKLKADKLLVIMFINKNCADSNWIIAQKEELIKKAWWNWVTFKTCEIDHFKEFAASHDIVKSPTVVIFKKWDFYKKIESIDEIKKFITEFKI
jgi:hypothetical protein